MWPGAWVILHEHYFRFYMLRRALARKLYFIALYMRKADLIVTR